MVIKVEFKARCRAEGLLVNAFQRLLDNNPMYVKEGGKLSLNRINNEARFGNSYIHKFKDFVSYAKPIIAQYNLEREKVMLKGLNVEVAVSLSEVDKLKSQLRKAEALKKRYRVERDNAIEARKQLEAENARLRFRVFDLQQELQGDRLVVKPIKL